MKRKIFSFALALLMLSSCLLFSGCIIGYKTYLAVVPTDQPFYSTLNYSTKSERDNYDYEYNFTVIRKSATVAGQVRDVIYVEYSRDDKLNDYYDSSDTLLFVAGKSFYLEDGSWHEDVSPLWTKWSIAYGAMGKSGTYVDLMTGPISNRHFSHRLKTAETSEYLEYTFKYDEETFRISNNMYHVLLYYHMKTDVFEVNHNATLLMQFLPLFVDCFMIFFKNLA